MSWKNKINPFGLAPIKRAGQKYDPLSYLEMRGEWPPKDFYTDEEREALEKYDGWVWVDD